METGPEEARGALRLLDLGAEGGGRVFTGKRARLQGAATSQIPGSSWQPGPPSLVFEDQTQGGIWPTGALQCLNLGRHRQEGEGAPLELVSYRRWGRTGFLCLSRDQHIVAAEPMAWVLAKTSNPITPPPHPLWSGGTLSHAPKLCSRNLLKTSHCINAALMSL